jgi:uncharacterized protein (TIGR03437 family)
MAIQSSAQLEILGLNPKVAFFSSQTQSTVTLTAAHTGTAQILLAGITPTSQSGALYTLSLNGTPVLQHLTVGADSTVYYEGPPGIYRVYPEALAISAITLPTAIAGASYTQTLTATGGTPPYRWSASLPAGLALLPSGVISGLPTAVGTFQAALTVTDSAPVIHTATLSVTLTVAPKLISSNVFPDLSAAAGSPLHPPALVTGGLPPYNCAAATPLPPGVSLNPSACVLTGTPSAPGVYSFAVAASDTSLPAQTAALSFANWNIANPLQITDRQLPAAVNGTYTFHAAGGYPPYSTGTVTLNGNNVTATVQDSAGNVSPARTFPTVAPPTPVTTLSAPSSTSVFGQSLVLTAAVIPAPSTGSVTFFDGTALLGAAPLVNGVATLSTRAVSQGARSLRASLAGGSPSAALAHTIAVNPESGYTTPVHYGTSANPLTALAGDFNGDTWPDLGVASPTGIDILLNRGDGTFSPAVHTATAAGILTTADFNGDGNLDVALTGPAGQPTVVVFLGNGDGTFQPGTPYMITAPAQTLSAADLNNDGIPDLAAGTGILLGNGDGTFYLSTQTIAAVANNNGIVADFNGDGRPDQAVLDATTSSIVVSEGAAPPAVSSGGGGGGVFLPPSSTITVSPSSLNFSGPGTLTVSLSNSIAGTTFTANATTNGGQWLSVTPLTGNTDAQGSLTVAVNPASLVPGAYTGAVNVTVSSGSIASIPVTLIVQTQLTVLPASLQFTSRVGDVSPPQPQTLSVFSNPSGIATTFSAVLNPGEQWLSVSASGVASVNPASVAPGVYNATVLVSSATAAPVSVPVTLTVSKATPIAIAPASQTFALTQSSAPVIGQLVLSGPATASVALSPAQGNWFTLAPATSSVLDFTLNPVGLNPGLYTAIVTVNQASAAIRLLVSAAAPSISLSQTGLTFQAVAGGPKPLSQSVAMQPAAASVQSDSAWLTVSAGSVTADPTGLAAGQYYGLLTVTLPGAANSPQNISVLLNVAPATQTANAIDIVPGQQQLTVFNASSTVIDYLGTGGAGSLPPGSTFLNLPSTQSGPVRFSFDNGQTASIPAMPAPTCTSGVPSSLVPVFRRPADLSTVQAGTAAPVRIQVADNCGVPVTAARGGAAQILFGSGQPPLNLTDAGNGFWEATWIPGATPETLQAVASQPSLGAGAATISVTVQSAASDAPALVSGLVNAAAAAQAVPQFAAPGAWVSIYGSGLNGAQFFLGNQPMPLSYSGAAQANVLIPQALNPNASYPLTIRRGATVSAPVPIALTAAQPAIYTRDFSGSGQGIAEIAGTSLLAAPAGSGARPAQRGSDYLAIFATGLGSVTGANGEPPPPDGAAAPLTTLYRVASQVTATVGGVDAPVVFAGLTPSLIGLYQVNILAPAGATAGDAVPLQIAVNSVASNTVTVALQ